MHVVYNSNTAVTITLMYNAFICAIHVTIDNCNLPIRARYGPSCSFIAVGDGVEEEKAAFDMNWPFVKIDHRGTIPDQNAAAASGSVQQRHGIHDLEPEILLRLAGQSGGSLRL